jgi:hypothetical protein
MDTPLAMLETVKVTVPRVNDKRADPATGERERFSSAILPPWCRKTPKITDVLPLLYLHGLSSGDFVPALGQFLGSAAGLSAPVITRLTETWKAEQRSFAARDLSGADYVYLWADGSPATMMPRYVAIDLVSASIASRSRRPRREAGIGFSLTRCAPGPRGGEPLSRWLAIAAREGRGRLLGGLPGGHRQWPSRWLGPR